MLHSIYVLFLILSLNFTFVAFEQNNTEKRENSNREKQILEFQKEEERIFDALKDKKILFALHIKKRTKQDFVEEEIVFCEENENPQESLQAKLKKKLQKLREKLQPKKHAIVAESIVLGTATSGAGITITGTTVAGFGAGCGAAGTVATATGTTVVATTGGITIGGVVTSIGTFIGGFVTWPVVVTVAVGGLVIGAIAEEAEKKNKLEQEEALKKREQEKVELEKERELEEQRIKLEQEKNVRLQQEERIDFYEEYEQDFIRIKEEWQRLQQEEKLRIQSISEKLEESIPQSTDYKRIFRPLKASPEDEEKDESVGAIFGTSILTESEDSMCIYVPVKQGPLVSIYVPAQNDNPPLIYVPAELDNPPCIYVPTEQEQKDLILHFAPPVIVIGGGILSGGTIPIIVGGGLAIGWIIKEGVPLLKGIKDKIKKHREKKQKGGGGGGGGNNNNNNDDDKDKKYPHGKYENNRKHHKNSPENIGKPPIDGQKALDKSIAVPKKDYRLAVENGELIKFQEHSPGKYHGYRVDPSQKVIDIDKNALQRSGLAKQLNKGNPYR